jgi:hypothetical protein
MRLAFLFATVLALAACTATPTPAPAPVAPPAPAATVASTPSAPLRAIADADVEGAFGADTPVTVTLHVRDAGGSGAMGPSRFQTVHEQKLHVLIADPSLSDYTHVHPVALAVDGDWRFSFTPRHDRPYRLWLDATPVGGRQGYGVVTINAGAAPVAVEKTVASRARAGEVTATLRFESAPRAGEMARGTVTLARAGQPLTALEPVMGTYGHLVGIGEDWQTIAHVHPLGAEPHAPGDRGGPALSFHLEPKAAGYLKLWLQVRVDGRELYLPFGVMVD